MVTPQVLLAGLFVPRDELPAVLREISDVLPLSYAVDAITLVSTAGSDSFGGVDPGVWADLAVVGGFAVAALVLGAVTLRRRTP